ncbi:hypothetical protein [Hyalangium gracile]|uniref:hypothetical protein n=1 Tax=Hyalangium gracile TaxID=394092 RepID=UPI001CCD13F7|nr:hypothetical protein [Hyalangium gracile]
MRFVLPLVALLVTAGPALADDSTRVAPKEPTGAPPKAAAPEAGPALRFAWPSPSRVKVTERILKKGKRSVVSYDAVLSARSGGGYEVKIDKFQFLEMEGRDLTQGPLPPELKAAAAIASALPTLVISADGEVSDVVGMEEVIERTTALVPEEKGMRDQVRRTLSQPAMMQMMKQRVGDFWSTWVGAWVGADLAAGEKRTGTVPMQLPSGSVDSQVTMHHRGSDPAYKGSVHLEVETVLEGEPFRKAMAGLVSQMIQSSAAKDQAPDIDKMLKSARRVSTVEVVTDPATLRPYRARMAQVTKLLMEGQEREEREEREYSFAWPTKESGKRR